MDFTVQIFTFERPLNDRKRKPPSWSSETVSKAIAQARVCETAASLLKDTYKSVHLVDASDATTRLSTGSLPLSISRTSPLAPLECLLDNIVAPALHSGSSTDPVSNDSTFPTNLQRINGTDFMPVALLCIAGSLEPNKEDAWLKILEGDLLESFLKMRARIY